VELPWFLRELACPDCGLDVEIEPLTVRCPCGFAVPNQARLDLRPQNPRPRTLEVLVCDAGTQMDEVNVERPATDYHGPRAIRDSTELFSAARPWLSPHSRFLDLGCGPRDQFVPASHLELDYVGVDVDSDAADLLADGHSIPFRSHTFDAVLAYAVLEHFHNPALALREVGRVLRPSGVFFGAVSQGEPFHASYFHHTAWGVLASFRKAGLRVIRLWPSFDTLHALATMGRYARIVGGLIEMVHRIDRAMPFLAPRQFLHRSPDEKHIEELHRAAAICFVAIMD